MNDKRSIKLDRQWKYSDKKAVVIKVENNLISQNISHTNKFFIYYDRLIKTNEN